MIDNFEQIKKLLKFEDPHDFYFLQIIQRKKDNKDNSLTKIGSNNSSRLIKSYNIFNIEQLEKYEFEIKELCKLFNARAGISLNKRNSKKLALEMMELLAHNIKSNHFNQLSSLWNTVCGQYHQDSDKIWIIDIDFPFQDNESSVIDKLRPYSNLSNIERVISDSQPYGDKIVTKIPSKSGYHLITKPFDSRHLIELYPDLEIHKNNPTNLYIP